jgi:hypothetical protein
MKCQKCLGRGFYYNFANNKVNGTNERIKVPCICNLKFEDVAYFDGMDVLVTFKEFRHYPLEGKLNVLEGTFLELITTIDGIEHVHKLDMLEIDEIRDLKEVREHRKKENELMELIHKAETSFQYERATKLTDDLIQLMKRF